MLPVKGGGNTVRAALFFALVVLLPALTAGCTPQQMLASALVPDGTASVLLGHLREVPDANRRRVVELEQSGDWAGLAAFADENIARDPFSPGWRVVAGHARLQQRDYPAAIARFSELLRMAPDDAAGYQLLAGAYLAAGQPGRALTTLERALLVVRQDALTYRMLGDANSDLMRFIPAAGAYRSALAVDPESEAAWFGLGLASLKLARRAEAAEALQALERLQSPRAAELRRLLAE